MEALPAICRKVDAERSRILCGINKFHAVTAEAKRKRKAIERRLDKLIDKMKEAW